MFQDHSIAPVWVNANPAFRHFERQITCHLARYNPIAYWEYRQHEDEGSSFEIALDLLSEYLATRHEPVDLIGHGTGGLLSLLYTRRYPQKVRSLTLLAVGFDPANDWQAHYYRMRKLLPCSQEILLSRMVQMMFGVQDRKNTLKLVRVLQQDLITAPSSHSLYQQRAVESGGVSIPLAICGSANDGIVDRCATTRWSECLKDNDLLWINPYGHHFFHYFFAEETARQVTNFWHSIGINSSLISVADCSINSAKG